MLARFWKTENSNNRHMKLYHILFTLLLTALSGLATAQPSAVKKALRSAFKITTFKADGTLNGTAYGAFLSEEGEAISAWTPFEGAATAAVIDMQGNKYDVDVIYGVSDMYNLVRFKVKTPKKGGPMAATTEQTAQPVGSEAWCTRYSGKSTTAQKLAVTKAETFMTSLPYYVIEQTDNSFGDDMVGTPIYNAQGQLMGLMNTSSMRTDLHVASAQLAQTLVPSGLSLNDFTLRKTKIRLALPTDYNHAIIALLLAEKRCDDDTYEAMINDFIASFPDKEDGYVSMIQLLTKKKQFKEAEDFFNEALKATGETGSMHYSFFKTIVQKETQMADTPYEGWSLQKALEELDKAIALQPDVELYKQQRELLIKEMEAK